MNFQVDHDVDKLDVDAMVSAAVNDLYGVRQRLCDRCRHRGSPCYGQGWCETAKELGDAVEASIRRVLQWK